MKLNQHQLKAIDMLALFGVCVILLEAFYYQLVLGELPCAFCNLIRASLMVFGGGLLLNLRFGFNPWNYALSAIGALVCSLISLLFLFVKAPPDSVPTGSAVLGLHMYSWTFIISTGAWMYCVFMLALRFQQAHPLGEQAASRSTRIGHRLHPFVMGLFIVLVAANVLSSLLQNGFGTYKRGGQIHYELLHEGDPYAP